MTRIAVADGVEPYTVYALGERFVVLLQRWDPVRGTAAWWGFVADRDGRARTAPVTLGIENMQVGIGQPLDEQRVGLIVAPWPHAKHPMPARWQTLEVGPDGTLTSTAVAIDLRDLDGAWEEAELGDKRGWVVVRDGVQRPEGVFAGTRVPAQAAARVTARDPITFDVTNAAVPPPPGPGGTIIEAIGQPMFARKHDGEPLGDRLFLTWHGNSIAKGMQVDSYIAWSGTRFLYPFWTNDGHDEYVEMLPIDCRP